MTAPLVSDAYTGTLKVDPSSFDASVCSLLICLDGEKYIDIFRSRNICQETLMELTDEDLSNLGIDDAKVRAGLIKEVKNFPMYEEVMKRKKTSDLDLQQIYNIIRDSSNHIQRINLSMISMNLALRRKDYPDIVVINKRGTTIIMQTLDETTKILNKMEYAMRTKFQCLDPKYESKKRKKILVGAVGGAVIAVLAVYFTRSLKNFQ